MAVWSEVAIPVFVDSEIKSKDDGVASESELLAHLSRVSRKRVRS